MRRAALLRARNAVLVTATVLGVAALDYHGVSTWLAGA